jgi:hypothetical protein
MADKTWVGGTSDDAAVDANWSPSGVPASNDKVEIPDASTTSNDCRLTAATSWGTLTIATDGILVGNGQTLTLNGGVNDGGTAADYNYTDAGQTSNVSGSLDIVMRNLRSSGDRAIITAAANNIRNLKIDDFTADGGGTGKVYTVQSHITISGDLTVEYGELNTAFSSTSYNLTVTGTTTIGPNSGAEDQATLTCNASTISLGSGYASDNAIIMLQGGTYVGGTGNHTSGAIKQTVANTKFTFTNQTHTINAEYPSDDRLFSLTGGKSFNSDGRITLEGNFTSYIQWDTTAGDNGPHNLRLNDANLHAKLRTPMTIEGDLVIDAGRLNTQYDGTDHKDLTVTGYCDVTGTLTLNTSTVLVAALRCNSGAAVTQDATGTLELTTASNFGGTEGANYSWRNTDGTSDINLGGTLTVSAAGYFEPRTAPDYASVLNNLVWNTNHYWVGKLTIGGTLVVNASKKMETYNGSNDCIVNGDVTLNGELKALGNNVSAMEFKSLTIASGGTYTATSGTTTITAENSSGFAIQNSGTFTHNNGLVDIDLATPTTTQASNGPYYDFTQSDAATDFYPAEAFEVMNNLSFVGDFEFQNNAHHLTVHGNMTIGDGTTTTRYMPYHTRTCNLTVDGILEVTTGATLTNFSHGTINVGGVRNTGGTM